jgi:hypothetical protein
VAELHLDVPKVAPSIAAGASGKFDFASEPRDLSMVTEVGEPIVAEGTYAVAVGGGQPHTGVQEVSGVFDLKGTLKLEEEQRCRVLRSNHDASAYWMRLDEFCG